MLQAKTRHDLPPADAVNASDSAKAFEKKRHAFPATVVFRRDAVTITRLPPVHRFSLT
jgi:hypothetical protein